MSQAIERVGAWLWPASGSMAVPGVPVSSRMPRAKRVDRLDMGQAPAYADVRGRTKAGERGRHERF